MKGHSEERMKPKNEMERGKVGGKRKKKIKRMDE